MHVHAFESEVTQTVHQQNLFHHKRFRQAVQTAQSSLSSHPDVLFLICHILIYLYWCNFSVLTCYVNVGPDLATWFFQNSPSVSLSPPPNPGYTYTLKFPSNPVYILVPANWGYDDFSS